MSLTKLFRQVRSTPSPKPPCTSLDPRRRTPVCDTSESSDAAPSGLLLLDDLERPPLTSEQRECLKSWWLRSLVDNARLQLWYDGTHRARQSREAGYVPGWDDPREMSSEQLRFYNDRQRDLPYGFVRAHL